MKMDKIIVANWKMNPPTEAEAKKLAKASNVRGVVICPPFPYISSFKFQVSRFKLGAQDVFWGNSGAYTGEVSALMLKNLGVEYVIIGHSERRKWLNETDEMINKKVLAALGAGLKAILCVGEPFSVRKRGLAAAKRFVKNQLKKDLRNVSSFKFHVSGLIIAYEPIWAIGTGRADSPEETAEMAKFIKDVLGAMFHVSRFPEAVRQLADRYGAGKFRVLYGGSVNSQNAEMFLDKKEIDGALVGGASIKPKEFGKIIKIAQRLS